MSEKHLPEVEVNPAGMTPAFRWAEGRSKRQKARPQPGVMRIVAWIILAASVGSMVYFFIFVFPKLLR